MLKDFMRRKEIDDRALAIAGAVKSRFPKEVDQAADLDDRTRRKVERKLQSAISHAVAEAKATREQMQLGVYGKARLYKRVQDELLAEGYSTSATRTLVEQIARSALG